MHCEEPLIQKSKNEDKNHDDTLDFAGGSICCAIDVCILDEEE